MSNILQKRFITKVEGIQAKLCYLFISIFLNTLGSAIIVIADVGVGPWSAAGINLAAYFPITLGTALLIISLLLQVIVIVIERNSPVRRIIFDFLFMFFYSYGVDGWLYIFRGITFDTLFINYSIFFVGMIIVAIAVSIYLQLNMVLHPIDLFFKMLKDRYLNGSIMKARLITFGISIVLSIFVGLLNHDILALSMGTFIYFLFYGKILDFVDKRFVLIVKNNREIEQIVGC